MVGIKVVHCGDEKALQIEKDSLNEDALMTVLSKIQTLLFPNLMEKEITISRMDATSMKCMSISTTQQLLEAILNSPTGDDLKIVVTIVQDFLHQTDLTCSKALDSLSNFGELTPTSDGQSPHFIPSMSPTSISGFPDSIASIPIAQYPLQLEGYYPVCYPMVYGYPAMSYLDYAYPLYSEHAGLTYAECQAGTTYDEIAGIASQDTMFDTWSPHESFDSYYGYYSSSSGTCTPRSSGCEVMSIGTEILPEVLPSTPPRVVYKNRHYRSKNEPSPPRSVCSESTTPPKEYHNLYYRVDRRELPKQVSVNV